MPYDLAQSICGDCFGKWMSEIRCTQRSGKNFSDELVCRAVNSYDYLIEYHTEEKTLGNMILLSVKRENIKPVSEFFAGWLWESAKEYAKENAAPVCVVNVPRAAESVWKYGHDQSREIAACLAKKLNCPHVEALQCAKNGKGAAQKSLSASERKIAVKNKYTVKPKLIPGIMGKRCILIDDVSTTGATLSACAELLELYGAKYVDCLTVGKTNRGAE